MGAGNKQSGLRLEEILKPLSVDVGKVKNWDYNTSRQEGKKQQSQSVSEMGVKNL